MRINKPINKLILTAISGVARVFGTYVAATLREEGIYIYIYIIYIYIEKLPYCTVSQLYGAWSALPPA